MSIFSTFRATNKLLIDAEESLGKKVSDLKAAGKEVSSKAVMEAVQKDTALTKNFAASYVDYMAKAAASGMKSERARTEFISGIVKSLPENLTDNTQKLRSAYRDTARFLDEIGTTLAPIRKQESIAAVTKTLGDLTPGRFARADLDSRLTALSQTAEKNGLVDVTLVRPKGDLKPKQAEEALLRGEAINPKELESIKAVKQADFEKWAKKDAANNRAVAASGAGGMGSWAKYGLIGTIVTAVLGYTGQALTGDDPNDPADNNLTHLQRLQYKWAKSFSDEGKQQIKAAVSATTANSQKDLSDAELANNATTAGLQAPPNLAARLQSQQAEASQQRNGYSSSKKVDVPAHIAKLEQDFDVTPNEAAQLRKSWNTVAKKPDALQLFESNATAILSADKTVGRDNEFAKSLATQLTREVSR